jgi:hypothetical protein
MRALITYWFKQAFYPFYKIGQSIGQESRKGNWIRERKEGVSLWRRHGRAARVGEKGWPCSKSGSQEIDMVGVTGTTPAGDGERTKARQSRELS